MDINRAADAATVEVSGDIAETTALKHEGIVGDVGERVVTASEVTFRPGERTRMHEHTYGQVLYVTRGTGVVGTPEGRSEVGEGDLIFFEPGEPHWHGTAHEDPVEFGHVSFVIRDEPGGNTAAVGDVEDPTES